MSRRVVVIGGGLAGIAAALDCAEQGAQVSLLEVRRRLGGAAYSVQRDGIEMDNGQHVFLRCCDNYRRLLARLGSDHLVHLQPRLSIPVLSPGRAPARIARSPLPAPLHLAGALAAYPHMTPGQKLGAARAARALSRLDPDDPALDRIAFGEWLAGHGQDEGAVAALWDLIALPTMNVPASQASLALAAFVFQTGLLAGAAAGDVGFHVATLQRILGDPALRALEQAGVDVRLGWRAQALSGGPGGFELQGTSTEGRETIAADGVVVALPHDRAPALLEGLIGPLRPLESSPIVNLHVVYDREVMEEPFAAGVGTPVQYLFDRSAAAGAPAGCQYLAVSLSGAAREMQMSVDELREEYVPALTELLPRARQARLESFLVTREHAATFRAAPGSATSRLQAGTTVPGLAVAGAWTATGWPATLEGAVMSGHAAAPVALGQEAGGARAGTPAEAGAPV